MTADVSCKLNVQLEPLSLGIMVEAPVVIFIMDTIIVKTSVNFISIDTNEHYILAADKTSPKSY